MPSRRTIKHDGCEALASPALKVFGCGDEMVFGHKGRHTSPAVGGHTWPWARKRDALRGTRDIIARTHAAQ